MGFDVVMMGDALGRVLGFVFVFLGSSAHTSCMAALFNVVR